MRITPCLLIASMAASPLLATTYTATVVEAESGTLGAGMSSGTDDDITYVTTDVDYAGYYPTTSDDIVSLTVTFPEAGTYELYVKLYVGSSQYNDDSMFYGSALGERELKTSNWVTVNGLGGNCGYTKDSSYIENGGSATNEVWKWVKLTGFSNVQTTYTVTEDDLTQTFQFAGREDGLLIDKFAFAPEGLYLTVYQIENGGAGTYTEPEEYVPTGPELASGKSKFLGSCYSSSSDDQNLYFTSYWNEVIPGNAGKWGWVEETRDSMDWDDLDEAYDFAILNGYPFIYHVLCWGAQQPSWVKDLSDEDQLEELKEWFAAVAARYPDIDYLQVVNEPINQPPSATTNGGDYIDALASYSDSTTDWAWVVGAFELAKEYFPNTKLMINEYSIVGSTYRCSQYLEIIDELNEKGLIDAIGIQGHAFSTTLDYGITVSTMQTNLDSLAATGLPIIVTEMDIDGTDDDVQLEEYQRVFPVFWEHEDVIGINMWGYRPGLWRDEEGAYLIDDAGNERPSMEWLRSYVTSSEDWMSYDVCLNWADTGDWLGEVYVGYSPWVYTEDAHWAWLYEEETTSDDGAWGYALNSGSEGSDTSDSNWMGYTVTNNVADTGEWLGDANLTYFPWVYCDYGWIYIYEDTESTAGAWAWFNK